MRDIESCLDVLPAMDGKNGHIKIGKYIGFYFTEKAVSLDEMGMVRPFLLDLIRDAVESINRLDDSKVLGPFNNGEYATAGAIKKDIEAVLSA